ncbi:hypothetical protein [Ornithinicoccus hortensis]|uniref:Uncharacterized protein n=1 Tax=Ornithinicoccus hortensis TaxID=82346 RepID=A0A542YP44_9MICO|nr:hypothetical protein [Ornithinicoccus hortensis]TQL49872.1 hypothetical protein FB467_0968 [Ornithinicoccus hortensis]
MFHMMNADLARDRARERSHELELDNARALSRDPLALSGTAARRSRAGRR